MVLTALVLLSSAAGHKKGGDDNNEERGMRSPPQKLSPRHSGDRNNDGRRVNSRRVVERVEYEYEYEEEDEAPRSRGRRPPPPPPRRHHGKYWDRGYDDDDDCYADNEDFDDYGIPLYFFVFTSRPQRPRNGFFVFAFMGGQPPYWFRNSVTTRKYNRTTTFYNVNGKNNITFLAKYT